MEDLSLVVTGDSIINRRVSVCAEESFLSLIKIVGSADVSFTHLETVIHDYDGPEVYPAAEGGWTYMRSPSFVVDELKWMGFDVVSLASNHCMDYSYGGMFSTLKALDKAGIPHAGTGRNLAEAREPTYFETVKGRIALISMCSAFPRWARAGETRRDVKGRPGLNPLRYHYVVDSETIEMIESLAFKLGWRKSRQFDNILIFRPPGCGNTMYKFVVGDKAGVYTVVNEEDAKGNLRSIKDATRQADYVLVQLHYHEWDPHKGVGAPATFVPPFARACIDAGADVFIGQGTHALGGIQIYKNKPIFYDPGDFMAMTGTVKKHPAEFYFNDLHPVKDWDATPADVWDAHAAIHMSDYHGAQHAIKGGVVAVCTVDGKKGLNMLKLHPYTLTSHPRSQSGLPMLANADTGERIVEQIHNLSSPYDTEISFKQLVGFVTL